MIVLTDVSPKLGGVGHAMFPAAASTRGDHVADTPGRTKSSERKINISLTSQDPLFTLACTELSVVRWSMLSGVDKRTYMQNVNDTFAQ